MNLRSFLKGAALLSLLAATSPAQAYTEVVAVRVETVERENPPQSVKKVGIGIVLGSPAGLNAKFWLSHEDAFEITAGWGYQNLWAEANYLRHNWGVFAESVDLAIPLYYGLGVFAGGGPNSLGFGPEATVGLDFIFKNAPFDIFIEAGPAILLTPYTGVFFHGGLGARFYLP